jgi:hypothetical protein
VAERGAARPPNSATRLVKNQESRICETLQQVLPNKFVPSQSYRHNCFVPFVLSYLFRPICSVTVVPSQSFCHNCSVTIVLSQSCHLICSVPFVPSHSFVTFFLSLCLRPIRSSHSLRHISSVTLPPSHSLLHIPSVTFPS